MYCTNQSYPYLPFYFLSWLISSHSSSTLATEGGRPCCLFLLTVRLIFTECSSVGSILALIFPAASTRIWWYFVAPLSELSSPGIISKVFWISSAVKLSILIVVLVELRSSVKAVSCSTWFLQLPDFYHGAFQ